MIIDRILNYFKYSFLLIKKNKVFFLLVVIQMAIISYSLSAIITYSNSQNIEVHYAEKLNVNKAVYYIGNNDVILNDELINIDTVITKYNTIGLAKSKQVELNAFSKEAVDMVKMPLYKGKWFDGTNNNGTIELVVSQNMDCRIGETFMVNLLGNTIEAEVVGILPKNFCTYRLSGGSSIGANMTTKFLFTAAETDAYYAFIPYEQVVANSLSSFSSVGGYYINFIDNISVSEYEYNLTLLQNNGSVNTIEQMIENSQTEYLKTLLLVIPIVILIVVLITTSVILIISITLHNSKQLLSIFFLYGARGVDIKNIVFCYGLVTVLGSYLVYFLIDRAILSDFIKNYGANIIGLLILPIISGIYIIFILLVTNIVLTKNKLISSIRETLL